MISPGNSPGLLSIVGNYTNAGTLKIELAGTDNSGAVLQYDVLRVVGNVTIDTNASVLNVIKIDGFEPSLGNFFDFLIYQGTLTGSFLESNITLPAFNVSGLEWRFEYGHQLTVSENPLCNVLTNCQSIRLSVESVVVPEPETYLMLTTTLVMAMGMKRRIKKHTKE